MKPMRKKYKVSVVIQEIIEAPDKLPVELVVDAKYVTYTVHHLEFHKTPMPNKMAQSILKTCTERLTHELAAKFAKDIKS